MPITINGSGNIGGIIEGGIPTGPVSAIAFVARSTVPNGWLKANGQAVSRTTYSDLFAAIGTSYGSGDGSTTFNVPDLRGYFPRGFDDGAGVDSGRSLGTTQTDAFQGHWHQYTGTTTDTTGGIGGIIDGPNTQIGGGGNLILGPISDGSNGSPRTAAETRPKNIALLAIIKY